MQCSEKEQKRVKEVRSTRKGPYDISQFSCSHKQDCYQIMVEPIKRMPALGKGSMGSVIWFKYEVLNAFICCLKDSRSVLEVLSDNQSISWIGSGKHEVSTKAKNLTSWESFWFCIHQEIWLGKLSVRWQSPNRACQVTKKCPMDQ